MLKAFFAAGVLAGFSIYQDMGSACLALGRVLEPQCQMLHERQSPCTSRPNSTTASAPFWEIAAKTGAEPGDAWGGWLCHHFNLPIPIPARLGTPFPLTSSTRMAGTAPPALLKAQGKLSSPAPSADLSMMKTAPAEESPALPVLGGPNSGRPSPPSISQWPSRRLGWGCGQGARPPLVVPTPMGGTMGAPRAHPRAEWASP